MSNKPTSEEQIAEYRKAFAQFDKDGDGKITSEDLKETLVAVGQTPSGEEVQDMLNELDADGSGTVDLKEFLDLMQRQASECDEEETLKATFNVFDKNGDGRISPEELREALTQFGNNLTDEDIDGMIAAADTNEDGLVSYEEFVKVMKDGK